MTRKKLLLFLFGVCIAAAVITGVLFGVFHSSSKSTQKSPFKSKEDTSAVKALSVEEIDKFTQRAEELEKNVSLKSYSDPTKESYTMSMLAIGDWGASIDKGSCCNRNRRFPIGSEEYNRDKWAQESVSKLMALTIQQLPIKPSAIIGHGDNFYWNGVGPKDVDARFEHTFEEQYKDPAFHDIPWINVLGNHDYGGDAYICGDADNQWRPCKNTEELLNALEMRFQLQATYHSPNNDRWILSKHYYVHQIKKANITVDIFNVDTNIAASHGARQICCQCYGYSNGQGDGATCVNADRGQPLCLGGNTEMYDACYKRILQWHDESFQGVNKDAITSKADFKIVNSHYSPTYHFIPERMMKWYKLLEETGIQIFINGHTHAESHDHGKWGTHLFENGAGGGIQNESPAVPNEIAGKYVKSVWTGQNYPYGFFVFHFSKEWIKAEFMTFDENWRWANNVRDLKPGGIKVDHCWYIPKDGSIGKEC